MKECKQCGTEFDPLVTGLHEFCSEKCEFQSTIDLLRSEKDDLQKRCYILNCIRTATSIEPDQQLTTEANCEIARNNAKKYLHELPDDAVFTFYKMTLALTEESYLVMRKREIKADTDTKIKRKLSTAMQQERLEQSLPKNEAARTRELFIKSQLDTGKAADRKQAEKQYDLAQRRESAIAAMVKGGIPRTKAEQLVPPVDSL